MKIEFDDKVATIPPGTRINEVQDVDINEIKAVVNANVSTKSSAVTAFFNHPTDYLIGTAASPVTTQNIAIDKTNAINGGSSLIYYSGNVLSASNIGPGETVDFFSGKNILDELCIIGIVYNLASDSFIVTINTQ